LLLLFIALPCARGSLNVLESQAFCRKVAGYYWWLVHAQESTRGGDAWGIGAGLCGLTRKHLLGSSVNKGKKKGRSYLAPALHDSAYSAYDYPQNCPCSAATSSLSGA
jgi:hypothetical protein